MFEFDGQLWLYAEMTHANLHDAGFIEWIETAEIADVFCGCTRIA
jgi:4-alpha-glucanotransferase